MFSLEFVSITILIGLLVHYLLVKRRVVHKGRPKDNFKRGMWTLVMIMLIFGLSFLYRVLNDLFILGYPDENYFRPMVYDLLLGVPYDLIPFTLILCLHRRNLKAYKHSRASGALYTDDETAGSSVYGGTSTSMIHTSDDGSVMVRPQMNTSAMTAARNSMAKNGDANGERMQRRGSPLFDSDRQPNNRNSLLV